MLSKRDMSPFPSHIPANIFESLRNHRESQRAMHLPRAFRYIPNQELYGYPPTVVQYKHEQTSEILQVKSYIWDNDPVRLEKQTVVVMKGRNSLESTVVIIPKKHLGTQLYTWEPGPGEGDLKPVPIIRVYIEGKQRGSQWSGPAADNTTEGNSEDGCVRPTRRRFGPRGTGTEQLLMSDDDDSNNNPPQDEAINAMQQSHVDPRTPDMEGYAYAETLRYKLTQEAVVAVRTDDNSTPSPSPSPASVSFTFLDGSDSIVRRQPQALVQCSTVGKLYAQAVAAGLIPADTERALLSTTLTHFPEPLFVVQDAEEDFEALMCGIFLEVAAHGVCVVEVRSVCVGS